MADRYWVGGTDNWNATAGSKWATTSGGAGGASVPTSSDNVYFDTLSGAVTVTISATANCLNLDFSGLAGLAHFTGTIAGSSALNIFGSLTLVSEMSITYAGIMTFSSTSTGRTITTNGKATSNQMVFNGTGGEWTLQDNWDNGSSTLTLTNGSLITNDKTVTSTAGFTSNSGTRSLTLGSSVINTGTWLFTSSGLTLSVGTSTLNITGNFTGGGLTYNVVNLTSNSTTFQTVSGANTFATLTRTNTSGYAGMTLAANQTVTGTFTATGNNNSTQRLGIISDTIGTARTITAATVSLTNVDFQDITGAGAATWSGTSIGNCGRNSNITFTSPANRYWIQDAGASTAFTAANWATSSGGTPGSNYPLPQDTAFFDANSFSAGSKTVTLGINLLRLPSINFTGVTNQPTFNLGNTSKIYGTLTLNTGVTLSGTSAVTFDGSTSSITTGTVTFPSALTINTFGSTFTFNDAFSSTAAVTLTSGTLSDGDHNLSMTSFSSAGSVTRAITGSGTWSLTGTGTVWQGATSGFTYSNTGTIKLTNSSVSTKTFAGAGAAYNNLWNATGNTGVVNITGSNTFNDFKIDGGRTTQFTAGTTTTVSSFSRGDGLATSVITIGSITAASHALAKSGGGIVSLDYLSVSRSDASPASTWYAGANSTDGGNNTGWIFTVPPAFSGGMATNLSRNLGYNLAFNIGG